MGPLARIKNAVLMAGVRLLRPFITYTLFRETRTWGDPARVHLHPSVSMANTVFNTESGHIYVGENSFTGHNVCIITGTHDHEKFMAERQLDWPREGRDVRIGRGVWIGTNATIVGPCTIGDHAVIAAGAVVVKDVAPGAIVGGVPAREIKRVAVPGPVRSRLRA